MKISVRVLNNDPLSDIQEAAYTTIGKKWDNCRNAKFLRSLDCGELTYYVETFIAKHSIIRAIHLRLIIEDCRPDVARQLLRATKGHPQPYMESGRPDWTGKPRSDRLIRFAMDFTPEAWMALANQRLCYRAMKETRDTVVKIVEFMGGSDDLLLNALAICSVPNCVFQGGCPEGKRNCGWFEKNGSSVQGIENRYLMYFEELFALEGE